MCNDATPTGKHAKYLLLLTLNLVHLYIAIKLTMAVTTINL